MATPSPLRQNFFTGNSAQVPTNMTQEFENLQRSFKAAQERMKQKSGKYKEVVEFADALSTGYITNLNVLVDVSKLMMDYRNFIDSITKGLEAMDMDLGMSLQPGQLQAIKNMTNDKLSVLQNFFQNDIPKVKEVFLNKGQRAAADAVGQVSANFQNLRTNAQKMSGGGNVTCFAPVKKPRASKTTVVKAVKAKTVTRRTQQKTQKKTQ